MTPEGFIRFHQAMAMSYCPFFLDSIAPELSMNHHWFGVCCKLNLHVVKMCWYSVLHHNKGELVEVARRFGKGIKPFAKSIKTFQNLPSPLTRAIDPLHFHCQQLLESSRRHVPHARLFALIIGTALPIVGFIARCIVQIILW
jgi:hypothetical protein